MPTKTDFNKELYDKFILGTAAINPQNQKEWDNFLTILDKETKLKWDGGERPTIALNWELGARKNNCCSADEHGYLTWCTTSYYKQHDYEIVTYMKLLKKIKEK